MSALPTGTVTFLFTDIEGSTKLIQRLGDEARPVFSRHDAIVRKAIEGAGGVVVRTEGDSFFAAFSSGPAALSAAVVAQRNLATAEWPEGASVRVRMGLHSGEGNLGGDDYIGLDVHRAARIAASAHGGQIVVSAATHALAGDLPGVENRDLGEHRFKDLLHPERVYQVDVDGLPTEFPPLASLSAIPNNLPLELTSFVDRPEVAAAGALLGLHRLLTLTGPGGTGKTRLALQIAADLSDRYDGVYFIPLAAVSDTSMVAMAISSTLGLSHTAEDPVVRLGRYLADRAFLLVLDNFEQVLDAAPVVAKLLMASPKLNVIVTSRAGLRIAGEQEFPVPPLAVPNGKRDVETLRLIGSVTLFVERAMAARPGFALDAENADAVAEITRRLDGLPLAIELAAARVKILPPQTMLQRLGGSLDLLESNRRDLPDRQRTLRGAITWSYDLLDEQERRLVRLMSVFRGGATLAMIEDVCSRVSGASMGLLGLLESLVDHSLVRPDEQGGEPRFGMLATIRNFAWEELKASDECGAVESAHLDAFMEFAERVGPLLTGVDQVRTLLLVDAERDNVRAAHTFAVETTKAAAANRLVAALWRYWHMRGLIPEGRERVRAALALDPGDAALRARSLEAAGGLAYWANDMAAALDLYRDALREAGVAGDERLVGFAHYNLAFPSMMADPSAMNVAAGIEQLDAAEAIFAKTGDALGLASVAWGRSMVAIGQEDFPAVAELGLRANEMFRQAGDTFMAAWSKHNAELAFIRLGDLARALPLAEEALDVFAAAGDVSGITLTLGNLVFIALALGEYEIGLRLWGGVDAIAGRSGVNLLEVAGEFIGLGMDEASARVDPVDSERWLAYGRSLSADEATALGREVIALARTSLENG